MANDKNHVYKIDLDVSATASSKKAFNELQKSFEDGKHSAKELNLAYIRMSSVLKDTTELDKQYNKIINNRIKDREKEIDKLKAMQIGIANNTKLSEAQRKNLLETTRKRIDLVQQEIDNLNRANMVRIKQAAKEAQLKAEELKRLKEEEAKRKKLSTYVKADLTALKDKIKEQFKFISTLKTTEGRYNAIKAAAKGAAKAGLTIGKTAGKVAIAGAGIASGLLGGALASADSLAEKEKAKKSLKSGIDPSIADEVFIKTGGDYATIVAAINNVAQITKDRDKLVAGAALEIQNPGMAKMLLSTSKGDDNNIVAMRNMLDQIRKQTGIQDMSQILESSTNARSVTYGKIDQPTYLLAAAKLQEAGFEPDHINKIINRIADKGGDFISNFNNTDFSKYTSNKQHKERIKNMEMTLGELDPNKTAQQSASESVAEQARKLSMKKDELFLKLMPIIEAIMPVIEPLVSGLIDLVMIIMPKLLSLVAFITKAVGKLLYYAEGDIKAEDSVGLKIVEAGIKMATVAENMEKSYEAAKLQSEINQLKAGGKNAQGGIITAPSIVGEAGPELVLPLDYSRAGRTSQIINNFNTNQSFNMTNNQTTPLALAQAVGNNRFVRRTSH